MLRALALLVSLAAADCSQYAGVTRRDCAALAVECPELQLTWVGRGCDVDDGGCRPAKNRCDFMCANRCVALLDDDGMPYCTWMGGRCMSVEESNEEYEFLANGTWSA